MKRTITLLIAFCIGFTANAQIQTKLWGLELAEHYLSLNEAKNIISSRCAFSQIEEDNITATDGTFGGYDWKFANFSFLRSGFSYPVLYNVDFSINYYNYESAKSRYDALLTALRGKYGTPFSNGDVYSDISNLWSDDTSTRCMLRLVKAESKGGDIFWYVILSYYDTDYLERAINESEDEL